MPRGGAARIVLIGRDDETRAGEATVGTWGRNLSRGTTLSSTVQDPELEEARRMGRAEGEAFESLLREAERSARKELVVSPPDLPGDLRQLAEFHHAVINSRSWRVLQAVRGIFGRAW